MQRLLPLALLALVLGACQMDSRQQILQTTNTQAQQRAISARAYDTGDQVRVFRAVIATLQDLGFVVDRADDQLGTVSATRFAGGLVRFTVSIRQAGPQRSIVRASGQLNQHELSDPAPFQRFHDALSQSLFLAANDID